MGDEDMAFLAREANACRVRAGAAINENLKKRWLDLAGDHGARAGDPPLGPVQPQPMQHQQQKKDRGE